MDSLPEYIEGTGGNSNSNVARMPTFNNFSSKCLAQTPGRRVEAKSLLFTNLIHILFNCVFERKRKYWESFRNNINFMLTIFVSRFAISNNTSRYLHSYVKPIIKST